MDDKQIRAEQFCDTIVNLIKKVKKTQSSSIKKAAEMVYNAVSSGKKFYVTGTGHSHMIAEEFYVRAGGLGIITPILPPEFMLHGHPLKSTYVERVTEYADVVMNLYPVSQGDVLLISSNSGRNGMVVEMARIAKERGAYLIAVTSCEGMKEQKSRHPSGEKLAHYADVVIDNGGIEGDAMCQIGQGSCFMGASSSIIGTYIVQEMGMAIAQEYVDHGQEPPVFHSSNVDGADAWNQKLFDKIVVTI